MILVRNSPHQNAVHTFFDPSDNLIVKSSSGSAGINNLRRELEGYRWYLERIGYDQKEIDSMVHVSDRKRYVRLKVTRFPGKKIPFWLGLSRNKGYLKRAIETYCDVWPADNLQSAPLHGDFSMDNVLFSDDQVYVIDWEHFHQDGLPWGFDVCNLFYESVYFSFHSLDELPKTEIEAYHEVKDFAIERFPSSQRSLFNHMNTMEMIRKNSLNWGELVNKFPVMKYSSSQTRFIYDLDS